MAINLYSQDYYSPIDSTIASFRITDKDWIIGLTIEQAGRIPISDSLGNTIDEDPNGTYIISQINNRCILRKLEHSFIGDSLVYKISKLISNSDNTLCLYNKDSILKAETEWIYPNIYFEDSLKVYDIQQNGNHSPYFRIYFRTGQSTIVRSFSEVDVFTSPKLIKLFHKNLNYYRNLSAFTYRAFMNIIILLRKNFKIRILE